MRNVVIHQMHDRHNILVSFVQNIKSTRTVIDEYQSSEWAKIILAEWKEIYFPYN